MRGRTEGLVGPVKGKLLDHALNVLQLGELHRVLCVHGVATGPGVDREAAAELDGLASFFRD